MNKLNKTIIEELEKKETKIRNEINKIRDDEIEKIQKPRLKKMVGQCYIYERNSYSCPKKESDYWNVYKKVIAWIDTKERGFNFICEQFYIDSNGKMSLAIEEDTPYLNLEWWNKEVPFNGYKKITNVEYDIQRKKLIEEMKTQKKLRRVLHTNW